MKDAIGNELKVGDLVAIQLARPLVYGRVAAIHEGGMIVGIKGGKQELHMSTLVVTANHTLQADPRVPMIAEVICLRDDHPPEPVEVQDPPEERLN